MFLLELCLLGLVWYNILCGGGDRTWLTLTLSSI